ncbi:MULTISPECIES: ATP-binding protein [unclassified Mycobacterium]|uniref:ATP-binding protein n=1 Tax=unclassified Mycobacterium TaxID=2642494 RepID=UPI0029C7FC07|nr:MULTISPECIES: ATP-binding protein [unclassified Mycobacterium]
MALRVGVSRLCAQPAKSAIPRLLRIVLTEGTRPESRRVAVQTAIDLMRLRSRNSRKSLAQLDFCHARWRRRVRVAHLGTLDVVVVKDNVVFLWPPSTGKCSRT